MATKAAAKPTTIEPHKGDKRYISRDAKGRIKTSADVSRSLAADRRSHSKTVAKPGQGDRGDRQQAGKGADGKRKLATKRATNVSSKERQELEEANQASAWRDPAPPGARAASEEPVERS
jgi:hypothetical protein